MSESALQTWMPMPRTIVVLGTLTIYITVTVAAVRTLSIRPCAARLCLAAVGVNFCGFLFTTYARSLNLFGIASGHIYMWGTQNPDWLSSEMIPVYIFQAIRAVTENASWSLMTYAIFIRPDGCSMERRSPAADDGIKGAG